MLYQADNVRKMESVQTTFTPMVCRKLNIEYKSYKRRLRLFNLDTMKIKRIRYELILIFKIIYDLIDLQFDDLFFISPSLKLYQLIRHKLQLSKPIPPATLIRVSFFLIPHN